MNFRVVTTFLVLIIIWAVLLLRGVSLQVYTPENLAKQRARQFETIVKLEPRRGDILDRNGKELAASIPAYSVFADPKMIKKPKAVSKKIARAINVSYSELVEKLSNKSKRFVWIERRLDREQKAKLEKLNEPGIGFVEEGKRIYPHDGLMGGVIGFVGREGRGLDGIESRFESELRGDSKQVSLRRDALGRPLISDGQVFAALPEGNNVQMTVDLELQYHLERELQEALEAHEAEQVMGVVLDAETSEVLAIGHLPGFNANDPKSTFRRSAILADAYEPGSTLKTFTIAAALREGTTKANTRYNVENGRMKVGDRWIREADVKHKWDTLTTAEILEVSSNIGVTKIAFDLGQEKLDRAFRDFGFGEKTGIEITGETRGILPPLPWRTHHFSNISFGHGVSVSPLQIAAAYASIANGGTWRTPTIVKGTVPQERRVLSPEHARIMRMMLTGVTGTGTGVRARIPGYVVAGKTGTAQKVNPNGKGYLPGAYISSFAGFVPAESPKFVVYVAVDSSKKGYYGSDVAAPLFNSIAEFALRQYGVPPSTVQSSQLVAHKANLRQESKAKMEVVPDLKGLTVREVLEKFYDQDVKLELKGQGLVMATHPGIGEPFPEGRKLKVELSTYARY